VTEENNIVVPQKISNRITIWPSNSFLTIYLKELKAKSLKDICTPIFIAALSEQLKYRYIDGKLNQ
jgi:hypothetical protein